MGDITQERDDNVYTSSSNIAVTRKIQGDTNNRYQQFCDGKQQWGSGSATPDCSISRLSAGIMQMDTGALATGFGLVNCTTSTLTVTAALHNGAIITLNRAAGIAVTLPAASGTGNIYRFFLGTSVTSNTSTIKVANSSDTMVGFVHQLADGGNTANNYEIGGTDDTITMDGSTTGGIKGDYIEIIDIATNLFYVNVKQSATGTEATPMSATV